MKRNKVSVLFKAALFLGLLFTSNNIFCATQNMGSSGYYDSKASDISWIRSSSSGWTIKAFFENALITFYFKQGPIKDEGLNISPDNPPYKIEFKDKKTGKVFIMKKISYSQGQDGKKGYLGTYEGKFKIGSEKFKMIAVSLVGANNGEKDNVNYHIFKDVN